MGVTSSTRPKTRRMALRQLNYMSKIYALNYISIMLYTSRFNKILSSSIDCILNASNRKTRYGINQEVLHVSTQSIANSSKLVTPVYGEAYYLFFFILLFYNDNYLAFLY
jgi:hypothetical protein